MTLYWINFIFLILNMVLAIANENWIALVAWFVAFIWFKSAYILRGK